MNRIILAIFAVAPLVACTPSQQTNAITIALDALPCYQAVLGATQTGDGAAKVLTVASVIALSPACVNIGVASANLIASAINAQVPVKTGPVPMPAARRRL